jgi:hypothetical protein
VIHGCNLFRNLALGIIIGCDGHRKKRNLK